MENYELPLVIFTSLSQTSVGLALFLGWRSYKREQPGNRKAWLITGIILAVSLIGAIFHLSYPFEAYNALINVKQSWLSREMVAVGVFAAAIFVAYLTNGAKWAALSAAFTGILLLVAQGLTYAAPSMIAIANGLPMVFYVLTAWVMGAACVPLIDKTLSVPMLKQGILMFVLALIIAPVIWSSGGTIMQMTAAKWGTSLFFWGSILCFVLAFILINQRHNLIGATAVMVWAGVFLSRLTFFGDTVSTIVNIGHPY